MQPDKHRTLHFLFIHIFMKWESASPREAQPVYGDDLLWFHSKLMTFIAVPSLKSGRDGWRWKEDGHTAKRKEQIWWRRDNVGREALQVYICAEVLSSDQCKKVENKWESFSKRRQKSMGEQRSASRERQRGGGRKRQMPLNDVKRREKLARSDGGGGALNNLLTTVWRPLVKKAGQLFNTLPSRSHYT